MLAQAYPDDLERGSAMGIALGGTIISEYSGVFSVDHTIAPSLTLLIISHVLLRRDPSILPHETNRVSFTK